MLRDKNLVPLSHQHQHALALCVRMERTARKGPLDLAYWQAEIEQHFRQEIQLHFAVEEDVIFPVAARYGELQTIADDLLTEHKIMRELFAQACARALDQAALLRLSQMLAVHIRKEEQQLFEGLQKLLKTEEMTAIGERLQKGLAGSAPVCSLPQPGN
jgi:hemerythrin-like domain-containing protein